MSLEKEIQKIREEFEGLYGSLVDRDVLEYQKVFLSSSLRRIAEERDEEIIKWIHRNKEGNASSVIGKEYQLAESYIFVDDLLEFLSKRKKLKNGYESESQKRTILEVKNE